MKRIDEVNLRNKTVIIRVDYNVPINDKLEITDDNRIKESLKTINYTGTQVQWNAISKGTSWKSGTTVNVIYNYKPE